MRTQNYERVRQLLPRSAALPPPDDQIIKRSHRTASPRLSIILVDWTCRERFDTLRWLSKQTAARETYELIWVELYERVPPEALELADTVITCRQRGMYHKHLGYNIGLLQARGELLCVCDSDAVYPADFVASILGTFCPGGRDDAVSLVLMHHELRTSFTYPDVLPDAKELTDNERWKWWPVVPNAGACMTIRREDALRFGGFDEDEAFRGYLCGPYELGWRLVNAGLPERWHDESVVLWHFAHPDPVGANGFAPQLNLLRENRHPHVDMHALAAVEAFSTGRLLPRRENPFIFEARMAARRIGTTYETRYAALTGQSGFPAWVVAWLWLTWRIDIFCTFVAEVARPIRGLGRALAYRALGEDRYLRARLLVAAFLRRRPRSADPGFLGDYKDVHILRRGSYVYGLPEALEGIDPAEARYAWDPAIIRGGSAREVMRLIERVDPGSYVGRQATAGQVPTVSIVVRTHAGRKNFLHAAIRSVLQQTYPDIEMIVVEDGSCEAEGRVSELRAPPGRSIVYRSLPKGGRSRAGNAGLSLARGRYVGFLDDDDLIFPNHVTRLVAELQNAGAACRAASADSIESSVIVRSLDPLVRHETRWRAIRENVNSERLATRNRVPIQAVLFERSLFDECGGLDEAIDSLEDWDLWLRYARMTRFAWVRVITSQYHIPGHRRDLLSRAALHNRAEVIVRAKHGLAPAHAPPEPAR